MELENRVPHQLFTSNLNSHIPGGGGSDLSSIIFTTARE